MIHAGEKDFTEEKNLTQRQEIPASDCVFTDRENLTQPQEIHARKKDKKRYQTRQQTRQAQQQKIYTSENDSTQEKDLSQHQEIRADEKEKDSTQEKRPNRQQRQKARQQIKDSIEEERLNRQQRRQARQKKIYTSEKDSTQEKDLTRHQEIRAGEKEKDSTQEKRLNQQQRQQQRIHAGKKAFPCTKYGRVFTGRANPERHQFTHSKTKKYICAGTLMNTKKWGCGRPFPNRSKFRDHFRPENQRKCILPWLHEKQAACDGAEKYLDDNVFAGQTGANAKVLLEVGRSLPPLRDFLNRYRL
ncbi:zinc finger protein 62 [Aspergillus brasiliensis]|nr:zinc finger protein 62 [Aspergillus brasiliensis]